MLFGEVPALPVVVPVAAATCAGLLWHLRRRGELTTPRALVALALCVYGAGIAANTVFPVYLDKPGGMPPWSSSINTTLFVDYELRDALSNVVVFVPLGVFAGLVGRSRSPWRVLGLGVVVSLLIETVQFFSHHVVAGGHVADVNDLFFNACGAPLGYGLFLAATRIPVVAGVAHRMHWPTGRRDLVPMRSPAS